MVSSILIAGLAGAQFAIGNPHGPDTRHWQPFHWGNGNKILTDIKDISQYWGQLTPYHDNADGHFGVEDVGLPDGCQIENAHTLQRHAQRYPTSSSNSKFATKVGGFLAANPGNRFEGQLDFLNHYQYQLGTQFLTGIGADTEFASGVQFWNKYGRTIYNATSADLHYNPVTPDGEQRQKPLLRTGSQSRIQNSQISWALGFFGPSYQQVPDPSLTTFSEDAPFDRLVIPEGGIENNTLSGSEACLAGYEKSIGYEGSMDAAAWISVYATDAAARLTKMAPHGFVFNQTDIYRMQSICAYDYANIGQSDFCTLFTEDEWRGFEHYADIAYYFTDSWGSPVGRASGVGYHQEVLARLTEQYITVSNSSVNSTLDDNEKTFPLNRPFYADFSHDDFVVATLTSMSIDHFHDTPKLKHYPVNPNRRFRSSDIIPFGARLVHEVIGCASADPAAVHQSRVAYTPNAYGYDASNAPHKFVRLRLNSGIVPLNSMRFGHCHRSDGLCAMDDFIRAGYKNADLANFQFACFANYTVTEPASGRDFDGTVHKDTRGIVVYPGELNATNIDM